MVWFANQTDDKGAVFKKEACATWDICPPFATGKRATYTTRKKTTWFTTRRKHFQFTTRVAQPPSLHLSQKNTTRTKSRSNLRMTLHCHSHYGDGGSQR